MVNPGLPEHLRRLLPADTVDVWNALGPVVAGRFHLLGGTAIAAHLGHRASRDLDFFATEAFAPDALADRLRRLGAFAVTDAGPGTLSGLLDRTRLQFLDASDQHPIEEPTMIASVAVAGLGDLLATKLKVIGDRGELRDYFDLIALERAGRRVEEGLGLFLARYRPTAPEAAILHIVRGLGYLADVTDDPALPLPRAEIERYWTARAPGIAASLDWLGMTPPPPEPEGPDTS